MVQAGDENIFALVASIATTYPNRGQLALGYFRIGLAGEMFGVLDPEATLLAASIDALQRRLKQRNQHRSRFCGVDARSIVRAYLSQIYGLDTGPWPLNIGGEEFENEIRSIDAIMAPDGDAAFDDGSHIIQFDCGDTVRLVGFKNRGTVDEAVARTKNIHVDANYFYEVVEQFLIRFESDWHRRAT